VYQLLLSVSGDTTAAISESQGNAESTFRCGISGLGSITGTTIDFVADGDPGSSVYRVAGTQTSVGFIETTVADASVFVDCSFTPSPDTDISLDEFDVGLISLTASRLS
jgi:hypothetical protein